MNQYGLIYGTWGNAEVGQPQYTGYYEPSSGYVYSTEYPSSGTRLGWFGGFDQQFLDPNFDFKTWFEQNYGRSYAGEDPKAVYSGIKTQVQQDAEASDPWTNLTEGALLGGAAAGIGALSGGFGIGDLFNSGASTTGEFLGYPTETTTTAVTDIPWGVNEQQGSTNMDWDIPFLTEESGLAEQVMTGDESLNAIFNSFSGTQPWEGLAADSSLQNAALQEAAGQVPVGTLAKQLGDASKAAQLLSTAKSLLGGSQGSYQFPWGNAIGSILEYQGQTDYQNQIMSFLEKALAQSDPFKDQRSQYFDPLRQSVGDTQSRLSQFQGLFDRFRPEYMAEYNKFNTGFQDLFSQYKTGYKGEYDDFKTKYQDLFSGYQTDANQMFKDPEYWANNSLLAGLNRNAVKDTSAAMSAQGYNMSGNQMGAIAERLQGNNAQFAGQQQQNLIQLINTMLGQYGNTGINRLNSYGSNANSFLQNYINQGQGALNSFSQTGLQGLQQYLNYIGQSNQNTQNLGTLAGAQFSPAGANSVLGTLGPLAAGAGLSSSGALGAGFNSVMSGQQPNYLQQMFGTPTNQNLTNYISGLFS